MIEVIRARQLIDDVKENMKKEGGEESREWTVKLDKAAQYLRAHLGLDESPDKKAHFRCPECGETWVAPYEAQPQACYYCGKLQVEPFCIRRAFTTDEDVGKAQAKEERKNRISACEGAYSVEVIKAMQSKKDIIVSACGFADAEEKALNAAPEHEFNNEQIDYYEIIWSEPI